MSYVYLEVIDLIASGPSTAEIAGWQPSERVRDRAGELARANEAGTLSADEQAELRHMLLLEHLMRRVQLRVQELATGRSADRH